MATHRYWFDAPVVRGIRIAVGTVAVATVLINIGIVASLPEGLDLGEYFSFFTNLSNLLAGSVFIVSGSRIRARLPRWWDGVRGAIAIYLALTGVVFAVLLADLPTAGTTTPWVNAVVHQIVPIVCVLDWLVVPAAVEAVWWRPIAWLAYPVAYLVYSLVRGPFVGWYPYPFLDPTLDGGYPRLLVSTGAVVVGFLLGAIVFDMVGRLRRRVALSLNEIPADLDDPTEPGAPTGARDPAPAAQRNGTDRLGTGDPRGASRGPTRDRR